MMNLICHQLAKMYGHEHFHNIFRNLSPGMRGREDLGRLFTLFLFYIGKFFGFLVSFHLLKLFF